MPPAPPRRLLLALSVSLGVHALVWLVLGESARAGADQRPTPPAPATLEFMDVEVTLTRAGMKPVFKVIAKSEILIPGAGALTGGKVANDQSKHLG